MSHDPSVFTVIDGRWILNKTIAERLPNGVRLHDGRYFYRKGHE